MQQLLHEWAKDKPNFLEPLWDTAYLETRIANPVNTNYFLHHGLPPAGHWAAQAGVQAQLQHAAVLAQAAAAFFTSIRDEQLPAEDDGRGNPVCMSQYPRVFAHARIAAPGSDLLQNFNKPPSGLPTSHYATQWMCEEPRHVAVLMGGRVATVDILDEGGRPLSSGGILEQLQAAVTKARASAIPAAPLGALTYLDRDTAAAARAALGASGEAARHLLHTVDSALFVLCLDGVLDVSDSKLDDDTVLKRVMHGQPTVGNRWFDKHNLIVMPHGVAAWNLEHAQGDATPILKLLDAQVMHRNAAAPPTAMGGAAAKAALLEAQLDDAALKLLQQGVQAWSDMDSAVKVRALTVPVGSSDIKAVQCSPDAFVQQVFQVACMALHKQPAAAYESVATRGFLHGRTEVGRSTSSASVQLARSVNASPKASPGEKAMLHAAIAAQNAYMKEAKAGHGVDRHMYALKCMAQMNKVPLPALLGDELATMSSTWRLSTSNAGTQHTDRFGYGPVTTGGYGLGYLIHPQEFKVSVASFEGSGFHDAEWPVNTSTFSSAIETAAHRLMQTAQWE